MLFWNKNKPIYQGTSAQTYNRQKTFSRNRPIFLIRCEWTVPPQPIESVQDIERHLVRKWYSLQLASIITTTMTANLNKISLKTHTEFCFQFESHKSWCSYSSKKVAFKKTFSWSARIWATLRLCTNRRCLSKARNSYNDKWLSLFTGYNGLSCVGQTSKTSAMSK